jgi:glycosyltransferase A (GT-A) superfamily protein (DUF2064 family)
MRRYSMCSNVNPIGLACFVKTPGRSPVKTRLAKTIGTQRAVEMYEMSLACLRELLGSFDVVSGIVPFWAVAEPGEAGNARWNDFEVVVQRGGSLGERLHSVYSHLFERFGAAMVIGSDSPQLSPDLIAAAAEAIRAPDTFVFGPASDGGFYLFGGSGRITAEQWLRVEYSTSTTGAQLLSALGDMHVTMLPELGDFDEERDAEPIVEELKLLTTRTPAQEALLDHLTRLLTAQTQ